MRCGRVRLTLFFPLHISNFLYRIENVVCHLFRTANLVDNGTIEGQIGEGCLLSRWTMKGWDGQFAHGEVTIVDVIKVDVNVVKVTMVYLTRSTSTWSRSRQQDRHPGSGVHHGQRHYGCSHKYCNFYENSSVLVTLSVPFLDHDDCNHGDVDHGELHHVDVGLVDVNHRDLDHDDLIHWPCWRWPW